MYGKSSAIEEINNEKEDMHRLTALVQIIFGSVLSFLFLQAGEISLSSVYHEYKPISPKILFLSLVYLMLGIALGLFVFSLNLFISTVRKKYSFLKELPPDFLLISGFIIFYALIVLNGYYLSQLSLFSAGSLMLNTLTILIAAVFFYLTCRFAYSDGRASVSRAVSLSFSTAVGLTILHYYLRPFFDTHSQSPCMAAVIAAGYIPASCLFIGTETFLMRRMFRRKDSSVKSTVWTASGLAKGVILILIMGVFVWIRSPKASEMKYAQAEKILKKTPNIILIVMDTVRQDHLSLYGYERETTPNLEKIGQKALVFDAYSTSHWTLPSHASLFTGLYPTENGTQSSSSPILDDRNITMAEVLAERGYATGAIVANHWALGVDSGSSQGFSYYLTDYGEFLPPVHFLGGYVLRKLRPDSFVFLLHQNMTARAVNRKAIQWVKRNGGKPFFLFLNYMDAHVPYLPPSPYDTMYNDRRLYLDLFRPPANYVNYMGEINSGKRPVTPEEQAFLTSHYDGAIRYLDAQIGELFGNFRKIGILDKSLVVVTSDHGEFFGEHNLMSHPGSLYQESVHVPLIVKLPAGYSSDDSMSKGPVSLVYLFHSILKLLDIPHETGKQDADIFGESTTPIFAECHLETKLAEKLGEHLYCLIDEELKLVSSSNGNKELFDLHNDPIEHYNLFPDGHPETMGAWRRLDVMLSGEIEQLNTRALVVREADAEKLKRLQKNLKALGYIQ